MSTLICTVGLPRSGKTTWAKQQNLPIVSPDAIRFALHGEQFNPSIEAMVWVGADYMIKALFLAGHTHVILDATNTTSKARQRWVQDDWDTFFKVFMTGPSECKKRADSEEIITVIDRMSQQWEELSVVELFWNV